jgi:hypothetical protein
MDLIERQSRNASISKTGNGFRLEIPGSDAQEYRLAQLDDYSTLPRRRFPHRSLTLSLHARASSRSIPGTWGFGLWNDPFGLSLGFGGNPLRLPALPNAVWFFHASPQNHLSFHDDKPAQGFLAQTFRSPTFHPLLVPAGLALPFSRKTARTLLGKVIEEDGVALRLDVTQWHEYRLEWSPKRIAFDVDRFQVLASTVSPRGPLGIVIWIDNQFAAFTPEGKIGFGVLAGKEEWLEIQALEIKNSPE